MDLLERSRRDIIGITMPGFGTTNRTKDNAITLALALSVILRQIPITAQGNDDAGIAEFLLGLVGHDGTEDLAFENSQAWCRKMIELTTGAKEGGLVLGTGDMSELALGWCTMFGDHASHYGVNSGVPKTLIRFLVGWAAGNIVADNADARNALGSILDTPVSPELLTPYGDRISQLTEEQIGPYELHDFTLYWGVRFGTRPRTIARLALHAFDGQYTLGEIVKWQGVFWKRFFAAQYKRSCLPDGPKVGLVCLSPRGDWRMPSDANANLWLADLDKVPLPKES
jgi:NAD+ synthase (glutamine-hydrolysing)